MVFIMYYIIFVITQPYSRMIVCKIIFYSQYRYIHLGLGQFVGKKGNY